MCHQLCTGSVQHFFSGFPKWALYLPRGWLRGRKPASAQRLTRLVIRLVALPVHLGLVGWKMTLKELVLRMRSSRCGKKAAEIVAVARPRPRGVPKNPH